MLRKTFPLPARILITPSFNHVVGALLNHTEQDRDVSTNTLELNIFKYRCGATLEITPNVTFMEVKGRIYCSASKN